ncbi:putative ADP-ribosylation factor protein [Blattamonas nauphoetae]|uniref:ADP-ribosylation factor protein n=1 Tax=Blattamonas nauphoetae TaxID=2049346 RepID=A0ABQ9Y4L9_9EUKA|nr:putative ADP-ribosylation factor protein [Blattamonas nauphoetae]
MFHLIKNLVEFCRFQNHIECNIALLGLRESGKTSILGTLSNDFSPPEPTTGFEKKTIELSNTTATFFDLSGDPSFKRSWNRYYADVSGIIFVVDSSNKTLFEENASLFQDLIHHPYINGKPILVCSNKRDRCGPTATTELKGLLGIDSSSKHCRSNINFISTIASGIRQLTLQTPSTTVSPSPHVVYPPPEQNNGPATTSEAEQQHIYEIDNTVMAKPDSRIKEGAIWLVRQIESQWKELSERIETEHKLQQEEDDMRKKERMERVRRMKEERLRAEEMAHIQQPPVEETDPPQNPGIALEEQHSVVPTPQAVTPRPSPSPGPPPLRRRFSNTMQVHPSDTDDQQHIQLASLPTPSLSALPSPTQVVSDQPAIVLDDLQNQADPTLLSETPRVPNTTVSFGMIPAYESMTPHDQPAPFDSPSVDSTSFRPTVFASSHQDLTTPPLLPLTPPAPSVHSTNIAFNFNRSMSLGETQVGIVHPNDTFYPATDLLQTQAHLSRPTQFDVSYNTG